MKNQGAPVAAPGIDPKKAPPGARLLDAAAIQLRSNTVPATISAQPTNITAANGFAAERNGPARGAP